MVVKKEQAEASTSIEEIATGALEALGPNVLPKVVVDLSDEESEGLIASVTTTTDTGPSDPGPSIPRVTIVLDMGGDWELARKLFVEMNLEAIEIPGDGASVDLISDKEDYGEPNASKVEEDAASGNKEEEGTMADDELSDQAGVPPSSPLLTKYGR